jgi:hypothetical protein
MTGNRQVDVITVPLLKKNWVAISETIFDVRSMPPSSESKSKAVGHLLGLLIVSEDGGSTFLRNVDTVPDNTK